MCHINWIKTSVPLCSQWKFSEICKCTQWKFSSVPAGKWVNRRSVVLLSISFYQGPERPTWACSVIPVFYNRVLYYISYTYIAPYLHWYVIAQIDIFPLFLAWYIERFCVYLALGSRIFLSSLRKMRGAFYLCFVILFTRGSVRGILLFTYSHFYSQ